MAVDIATLKQPIALRALRQKAETLDLVLYWRSISRRKWSILGFSVGISILAAVIVFIMTPIYRSTVTLMIEQNKSKVLSIDEVYSGIGANREQFQTQVEILKSPDLASKVIDKLKLTNHPEFDPRPREGSFWNRLGRARGESETAERKIHAQVLTEFLRRVTIEPVRMSQLVKVSFDAADPELAAEVANTLADTFIENDMDVRYRMTKRATDWLSERMAGLKKSLEQSERALQDYRERERIIDTKGLAQSGAARQIEDLTKALIESRQRRAEAENAYMQMKSNKDVETLPIVVRNPLIARFKELENDTERKVAELASKYGREHPRLIQAEGELKQARENTRRQIDTVLSSLTKEYEVARANEKAVERTMSEAKGYVQGMNRKEFQLSSLERGVATNRQLYEMFLNRYKETSAASDIQGNAIARVIDVASPSLTPVKPAKSQVILIAFVLGIFFGVVTALLLERLDNTVKSADDVEEKLGQPMLTMLPLLSSEDGRYAGKHYLKEPRSVFSEAIRTARTSLLLSSLDAPSKILVVTSSVPAEGKTSFAINLALAHAQTKKVLLIEADLRAPSMARQLELDDKKPGLTDLVAGSATLPECLQRIEGSSLFAIASGPIPVNPLELILSHRFKEVINRLANACDILIIDSAPVHLVSDALVISTMSTGVLFVIKAESTPYQLARRCIRTLQDVGAKICGVTLNQLDFEKAERYYGAYTGTYGGYYTKTSTSKDAAQPPTTGLESTDEPTVVRSDVRPSGDSASGEVTRRPKITTVVVERPSRVANG